MSGSEKLVFYKLSEVDFRQHLSHLTGQILWNLFNFPKMQRAWLTFI